MPLKDWIKQRIQTIKTETMAAYYAFQDPRIGLLPKAVLFFTIAYAFSPIDLIPDFIPVLGYLDDLIILPILLAIATRFIPDEIYSDSRRKAVSEQGTGKERRWLFVPLILFIWGLAAFALVRWLFL